MHLRSCLLTLVLSGAVSTACAQQPTPSPKPVWVNLGSGVYHCPGTEHYGTTRQGEYLPEAVAIDSGYRANGGRPCSPALAAREADPLDAVPPPPRPLPDSGPPVPGTGLTACVITRVRDGDTIECQGGEAVRLIGIDSPERDQSPFGAMATRGLLAFVSLHDTIQLSSDKEARDQYGRVLAYLWIGGGELFNELIIRQGFAAAFLKYPFREDFQKLFRAAAGAARKENRGFWRTEDPEVIPVSQVRAHLGEIVSVRLLCAEVLKKGSFLCLRPAEDEFEALIPRDRVSFFPGADSWEGKEIRLTGFMEEFAGRPQMIVSFLRQLRLT